ncbi:MAG: AAA family ATPase [Sumerlaeia bacterium]
MRILAVSPDDELIAEITAALDGPLRAGATFLEAPSLHDAAEIARGRQPDLVLVGLPLENGALRHFVEELALVSPASSIVGLYRPQDQDSATSAMIVRAFRGGVMDVLRRPIASEDLDHVLAGRDTRSSVVAVPARTAPIAAFFATKGGVGKSTLAVNTSVHLAKTRPGRVLLVDASIQLGVCGSLLDLAPKTTLADAIAERSRLDPTLVRELATPHKSGLHVLAAPGQALEGAEIDEELLSRLLTTARRAYDLVVVDCYPMLDRLTLAILDLATRVYIVMEPSVPTLRGTEDLLRVMEGLQFPKSKRRVVLNRADAFSGALRPEELAARLGEALDPVLPFDKQVLRAANLGVPAIEQAGRWSKFRKAVEALAADMAALETSPASGAEATR